MKNNQTKPPIGTANTGYEIKVDSRPPVGEGLANELKKGKRKPEAGKKVKPERNNSN